MKDLILGSHLFFAREGETIDAVVVAADAKPDVDPETNFTKFGCVERFQPQNNKTEIPRRCPSPGKYRTRKKIPLSQTLTLNFGIQEWDEMSLAELLMLGSKPAGGVFVPNAQVDNVRGWLKIQSYDQTDALILAMDVWAEISIQAYQFEEGLEPYALVAEVLYSELNTGAITNL